MIDSARMDNHSALSDQTEPYFLVGAVRSGTTMLRLLLGHHPAICRCPEFEFVTPAIAGRADWPDIEEYGRSLQASRQFRASGLTLNTSLSFPAAARDFLRQLQQADGRAVVGTTVHNHFDELPRIWPNAKFIYLERDPRDVARSCVQMGFAGNAWGAAEIWKHAREAWLRLRQSLPPDRFVEVRFETLMTDTVGELSRIARFLGTEFDPAMLELEKDTSYKRPDPAASRSWRNDAAERDVRQIEAVLGPLLREAGHEPSGLPPLRVGIWDSLALTLEHRHRRIKFAQQRYGLGLWLGDAIARRLPVRPLRHHFQRKLDKINERYLK
ncbi:sulfotransferase family protein [Piscinibacter sp.]|uniref:sulfotransferase family protein n=1 Tax=Piscinibacter sp. TaxID=1903157 RepID=UPI002C472735|nr:sulfotransferase [Albitalea sp.]HUG23768.1 sulfotransferase [Albitalea sp.]